MCKRYKYYKVDTYFYDIDSFTQRKLLLRTRERLYYVKRERRKINLVKRKVAKDRKRESISRSQAKGKVYE